MQGTPGSRSVARLPRLPRARTATGEPHSRTTERKLALNRPALEARIRTRCDRLGVRAVTVTPSWGWKDSPRTTSGCVVMSRSFGVAAAFTVGATPRSAVAQTAERAANVPSTFPTLTRLCEETMKPIR